MSKCYLFPILVCEEEVRIYITQLYGFSMWNLNNFTNLLKITDCIEAVTFFLNVDKRKVREVRAHTAFQ